MKLVKIVLIVLVVLGLALGVIAIVYGNISLAGVFWAATALASAILRRIELVKLR